MKKKLSTQLAEAAALVDRTGATTVTPSLCEARAELCAMLGDETGRETLLREAVQGFEGIGAPAHAARVSSQLAS